MYKRRKKKKEPDKSNNVDEVTEDPSLNYRTSWLVKWITEIVTLLPPTTRKKNRKKESNVRTKMLMGNKMRIPDSDAVVSARNETDERIVLVPARVSYENGSRIVRLIGDGGRAVAGGRKGGGRKG